MEDPPLTGLQGTVAETNQRLEMTMGPGVGGAGIVSLCSLAGDFDVQVDYDLLNWPTNNRHSLQLRAVGLGTGPFGAPGPFRLSNSQEFVGVVLVDNFFQVPTADTSGKLRMARTGTSLSGYFHNGTDWVLLGSGTATTVATQLAIEFGSNDPSAPGGVKVAFNNFKVNAGALACPSTITVNSNLPNATFTLSPPILGFPTSGPFPVTMSNIPAGSYKVTWNPISGHFPPPPQQLTLQPGGSIAFQGTYFRIIVVLFSGYWNGPHSNSGMRDFLREIRDIPALQPGTGTVGRLFTFYTDGNGDRVTAPRDESPRLEALQWVRNQKPEAQDKIVVIGHSYGGNRARLFVSNDLFTAGYEAQALVTVDPIDWMLCSITAVLQAGGFCGFCNQNSMPFDPPIGVPQVKNFFQSRGFNPHITCIQGYTFRQVKNNRVPLFHTDIIDDSPAIHNYVRRLLLDLARNR